MATAYGEIFDSFMSSIDDYRLVELYTSSTTDFENYLLGWLKKSIVEFSDYCTQDLSLRDDDAKLFDTTLTEKNVDVLARLMVKYWLTKEVNDVLQMRTKITDHDFKHYAESASLREKQSYLQTVKEECSQLLLDYAYKNNDWVSWAAGDFGL